MKKIVFILLATCFVAVGCKKETKKQDKTEQVSTVDLKETSFKISGMTCEVGCAKAIASKLSKKEGVVEANVIFSDSIAKVKFDASKINEKELKLFVEGIGDGKTYKTGDAKCCDKTKKECCKGKKEENKTACKASCKKECSKDQKNKIACDSNCKKECCKKA